VGYEKNNKKLSLTRIIVVGYVPI